MNKWRNQMLPQFVFHFATPAAALPGSDGGSGAPATGGGAGAGGGTPVSTGGAPAATPQVDWNANTVPAQLREGYNKLKADYEKLQADHKPWQSLNVKPEEVGRYQQSYQGIYNEMKGLAESLANPDGTPITEAELAAAIQTHGLLPVLDQLRYEAQQAEAAAGGDTAAIQQQELEARIQAGIETRLSPVLQRENQRMVTEANALVERSITELATTSFKTAGLDFAGAPPALKDFILTGVTEALKYDDEGMRGVKFEGKTAPIQKAFQTFQAMWDAAYLARRQMEGNVAPGPRQGQQRPSPATAGKQPSLEEMINDPDSIRKAGGRPAYST